MTRRRSVVIIEMESPPQSNDAAEDSSQSTSKCKRIRKRRVAREATMVPTKTGQKESECVCGRSGSGNILNSNNSPTNTNVQFLMLSDFLNFGRGGGLFTEDQDPPNSKTKGDWSYGCCRTWNVILLVLSIAVAIMAVIFSARSKIFS